MTLRPNIFAADQNSLKHFLQIHRFLGDVYTIKKRWYTDLQMDVCMGINCSLFCNSKQTEIIELSLSRRMIKLCYVQTVNFHLSTRKDEVDLQKLT